MKVITINPSNEQNIQEYETMSKYDVNEIVRKSKKISMDWKKDMHKRIELLHKCAEELRKNKKTLALVATNEMGKPIKEAIGEVEKCATAMEYYGDNGQVFMNDEVSNTDARKTLITFQPLGVIGSIMPWNFPYWQALRFAAPFNDHWKYNCTKTC